MRELMNTSHDAWTNGNQNQTGGVWTPRPPARVAAASNAAHVSTRGILLVFAYPHMVMAINGDDSVDDDDAAAAASRAVRSVAISQGLIQSPPVWVQ